jgi:ABC-type uncharacterized transport system permease subunit
VIKLLFILYGCIFRLFYLLSLLLFTTYLTLGVLVLVTDPLTVHLSARLWTPVIHSSHCVDGYKLDSVNIYIAFTVTNCYGKSVF